MKRSRNATPNPPANTNNADFLGSGATSARLRDSRGRWVSPITRTTPPETSRIGEDTGQDLVALPFTHFARIVADLLTGMGYTDVQVTGRGAGGGRNGTGGYDLQCFVSEGFKRRRVIVLLKQFGRDAWVFQRMVDELRGVAIREGADEAILITTGRLSPVIAECEDVIDGTCTRTCTPASRTIPPVHRIGGEELDRLLEVSVARLRLPGASGSALPPAKRKLSTSRAGGDPKPRPSGMAQVTAVTVVTAVVDVTIAL